MVIEPIILKTGIARKLGIFIGENITFSPYLSFYFNTTSTPDIIAKISVH